MFSIREVLPYKQQITCNSKVYICRTSEEICLVLEFSEEKDDKICLLHIPQKGVSEEDYEKAYVYALETAQAIAQYYYIKLEADDVFGWQRKNIT